MDWLDLLAVQGTLKSVLQHHSSKASILRRSAFFRVQLSHPYKTTGKTIALTRRTFVGKVMSLVFFKFIYFNWRLITLQYCGGFCHTLTWITLGCTCVSPFQTSLSPSSQSHPSGLSHCTSFEWPIPCIKRELVNNFTYGNKHVSMLFSQMIPFLPSPTESKSLFFIPVSLLLEDIFLMWLHLNP